MPITAGYAVGSIRNRIQLHVVGHKSRSMVHGAKDGGALRSCLRLTGPPDTDWTIYRSSSFLLPTALLYSSFTLAKKYSLLYPWSRKHKRGSFFSFNRLSRCIHQLINATNCLMCRKAKINSDCIVHRASKSAFIDMYE